MIFYTQFDTRMVYWIQIFGHDAFRSVKTRCPSVKSFFQKPIRRQFQIVLACLLVLGLALTVLAYGVIHHLIAKNASIYAQNTARQFDSEIAYLVQRTDSIFNSLLFDENVEQMMVDAYTAQTPAYLSALQKQFSAYRLMNRDLSEIALVSPDMAWSSGFDAATLRSFAAEIDGAVESVCLGLRRRPLAHDATPQLIFARNKYGMYDPAVYGKPLGCILLSLDLSRSAVTLPQTDRDDIFFLLLDAHGNAYPFNCDEARLDDVLAQCLPESGALPQEGISQTRDYQIHISRLKEPGLFIVCAASRQPLIRDASLAALILAGVVLLTMLAVGLLMHLILLGMVRPLGNLSAYLEAPEPERRAPPRLDGCAEIVHVSRALAHMMAEQDRLNRELQEATVTLYETKLGLQQAELDFLRSQINPHFLYNALEAIRAEALLHGGAELADAVGGLSTLFRYNVKGDDAVPLAQELEITRAYLAIQTLRFRNRLEIMERFPEETLTLPVMKLILQPVVENAVYHGLEPKLTAGTLYLTARMEENDLKLCVYDDGVGIPPDTLAQLRQSLEAPGPERPDAHVGLWNVQHRIRLYYGRPYGLTVESAPDKGTKVTILIPAGGAKKGDAV